MSDFCAEPAVPGPLKGNLYPGPDVMLVFTASRGRVQNYIVTLTPSSLSQTVPADGSGDQSVTFANLTEGSTYQVTIVATIIRTDNSHSITSDMYNGTFRVKPSSKSMKISFKSL